MLLGHFGSGNWVGLIGGLISIVVGVALILRPTEFEDAAAGIQRSLGPGGRKVASTRRRWATVSTAIIFIAFGVLMTLLGLFGDFDGMSIRK